MRNDEVLAAYTQALKDAGFSTRYISSHRSIIGRYLEGVEVTDSNAKYRIAIFEEWKRTGKVVRKRAKIERKKIMTDIKEMELNETPPAPPKKVKHQPDWYYGMDAAYMDSHSAVWRGPWEKTENS